ncbi:serine hydrolase [Photobacterium sanctipauli]|uniref:serine hydrolase domain-containing protein n=1 Tax=Photobacterium sanctipauli TaxID=1342794 RepID=UPI00055A3840
MKTTILALFTASVFAGSAFADATDPAKAVEAALQKEGAQVTLPVSAVIDGFSADFAKEAKASFNNFHYQMGGDHALYYNSHLNEMTATAQARPNENYKPLARNLDQRINDLKVETSKGELSLTDYMAHPHFRHQAMVMVHKGKVVYEAYPGMKPTDQHVWFSAAKTTAGILAAQLVESGELDMDKMVSAYIPELKGTVWDDVTVASVVNMTTGLDNEETLESIMNPDSAVVRYFASILGSPRASTGEMENWLTDVSRAQTRIEGEAQGDVFRYASINTSILVQLIENVTGKTFTKTFEDQVWGKMYARQSANLGIAEDGHALAVGLLQTTPEDMVRFATLFTPSWNAVAEEQVVSPELIKLITSNQDAGRYAESAKRASSLSSFGEYSVGNAFQFDFIFEDGAMAKSGNLNQMIYMDPERDFAAVVVSTSPYHSGYGESKAPTFMRKAAKMLAGE